MKKINNLDLLKIKNFVQYLVKKKKNENIGQTFRIYLSKAYWMKGLYPK